MSFLFMSRKSCHMPTPDSEPACTSSLAKLFSTGRFPDDLTGQLLNNRPMLRKHTDQRFPVSQFKILKIKSRCDKTAGQSITAGPIDHASEPASSRNTVLKRLALLRIGSQLSFFMDAVGPDHMNPYRVSCIKIPEFIRFQTMKTRDLTTFQ